MNDQDAPGAAPETQIKVFISYKTREHARYVDEISAVLRAAGFDVWYDEERDVPELRVFGLDVSLTKGLDEADAMLILIPREPAPPPTKRQWLKDFGDTLLVGLGRERGEFRLGFWFWLMVQWNRFWYGLDLEKYGSESWQDWERRVGQAFGLAIVHAVMQDPNAETIEQPDASYLRPKHLQDDLYLQVIPRLQASHRSMRRPSMTPDRQRLFRFLPVILATLWAAGLMASFLEWVGNAILWLPRQIANIASRARSRLDR